MKVVYIAHPLSAETAEGIEENRENAARWAVWAAIVRGVAPQCSWIVLSSVLPETAANRLLGLSCDIALVSKCDEVWLVGGRISTGMNIEAQEARRLRIPVFDLTHMGYAAPALVAA